MNQKVKAWLSGCMTAILALAIVPAPIYGDSIVNDAGIQAAEANEHFSQEIASPETFESPVDSVNSATYALNDNKDSMSSIASVTEVTYTVPADGLYTVDVYGWHATRDAASMMGGALDKKATLKVKDGQILASIKFVKTSIMGIEVTGDSISEVWPEPEGATELGTGVKGMVHPEEQSQTYQFPLKSVEMPKLAMYVGAPLNSVQNIRLKFDLSTLTPIEEPATDPVIQDGLYTVDVYGWHATRDAASMMSGALDKKATLKVKDGQILASIKFVKTSIMGIEVTGDSISEVWPEPEGATELGTGIKGTVHPEEQSQTYQFPLKSVEMPKLAMYVGAPLNSVQNIRLKFDLDTLTPIQDDEEPGEQPGENPAEPDLEAVPDRQLQAVEGTLSIAPANLEGLNKSATLGLVFDDIIIVFPARQLQELLDQNNGARLQLKWSPSTSETLKEIKGALNSKDLIISSFDLQLEVVNHKEVVTPISGLGGRTKIIASLSQQQASQLFTSTSSKLYYYDPAAGSLEDMNASFNQDALTASFYTDHFSTYSIVGHNPSGSQGGGKLDPANLPDGEYTIKGRALKEYSDESSLSNSLISNPIGIEVRGGHLTAILVMKGSEAFPLKEVQGLWYENRENEFEEIPLEYNASSNSIVARFSLTSLMTAQKMQVSVPNILPDKPIFRLVFDLSSLQEGAKSNMPDSSAVTSYLIKATADQGGKITPEGEVSVAIHENKSFEITADEGYLLKDVLVNDKSVGAVSSYTFEKVTSNATIHAVFEKKTAQVNETEATTEEGASPLTSSFVDTQGHWAESYIQLVVSKGLFKGTDEQHFSPDATLSRGMLLTLLGRLQGPSAESYTYTAFKDVPLNQYYTTYITWAVDKGIVQGAGNGLFHPDQAITRQELAVIMASYLKHAKLQPSLTEQSPVFSDQKEISTWAQESALLTVRSGLLETNDQGQFSPKATLSRAEAAKLLALLLELTGQ
ncbi:NEAT domain-containing protein [Paenibacillus massiliensis]|uniref:NEAT domain-containing protein n=1 Tax=Paenibacillus massiliensis TaxID=225917 RepID=UPI000376AF62|nr:NEAT domain-containing protein [Paenibacillus massiliensis]